MTDEEVLVYLADEDLPWPANEKLAEYTIAVFRQGEQHSADIARLQAEVLALAEQKEALASELAKAQERIVQLERQLHPTCDCEWEQFVRSCYQGEGDAVGR